MGKISSDGMKKLLVFMEDKLNGMDTMSIIVAGMIATKHLANPEFVVNKIQELKSLSKNIQLNKEKEIIMHSTHSLKRFIDDETATEKKRNTKEEEKKKEIKPQTTQRSQRSQRRSQNAVQRSTQRSSQQPAQRSKKPNRSRGRNRRPGPRRTKHTVNKRTRKNTQKRARRPAQRRPKVMESEEDESQSPERPLPKVEEVPLTKTVSDDKAEENKEKSKNVETIPDDVLSNSDSSNKSVECLTMTNWDICGSKYLEPDIVSNTQCIHQYHEKCLRSHIMSKLSEKWFPFRCPVKVCKKSLSRQAAMRVIKDESKVIEYDYLNFFNRIGKGKKALIYWNKCK